MRNNIKIYENKLDKLDEQIMLVGQKIKDYLLFNYFKVNQSDRDVE